jgi:hypothetical protein
MSHPTLASSPRRLLAAACLVLACAGAAAGQVEYVDEAVARGIDMTWTDARWTLDYGSGTAMDDFDRDGDLDIFLGTKRGRPLGVYRNDGAGVFTDISDDLGLAEDQDIKQVLLADLDNDGWRDVVVSLWHPDESGLVFLGSTLRMYRNLGDGTFERQHPAAADSVMLGLAAGVSAGDLDRDGDLDLYVSVWKAGQSDSTCANRLLRNDRNWTFTDRAAALGVDDSKKSFQSLLVDLSGDGWLDILVSEDKRGGLTFFESDGEGGYTDRSFVSGLSGWVQSSGNYCDGMGMTAADYDGDWDLDVYVTNIFDGNLLYRNNGDGTYTNVATEAGTVNLRVGWGTMFFDCDNDRLQDLYVVDFGMNGTSNNVDRLYCNQGNRTFTDIAPDAGITWGEDGFGLSVGDVNGDGGMDVLILHAEAPVRLLMNQGVAGNWIGVDLIGTASNTDAVGATVEVWVNGAAQIFPVLAGEGYLSTQSHVLEVGLGDATKADAVTVHWPSGQTETFDDLEAGRVHTLVEAENAIAPVATANWLGSVLNVSWQVNIPTLWDRFELWRTAPGPETLVGGMAADATRYDYFLQDIDGVADAVYELRSYRLSVPNEAMTESVEMPDAPELPSLQINAPRPNPFNPRVVLRYYAPAGETPRLRIYDIAGRPVATLAAPAGDGWQSVVWEGLDDGGRAMPSGLYVFEVQAGGQTQTRNMTLVR